MTNRWNVGRLVCACAACTIGIIIGRVALTRAPKPEPLFARTQLVKKLTSESSEESARKLARFDDALWAAAAMGEASDEPTKYDYLRIYLPSLSRVRKVLQAPASDLVGVTPILREQLRESLIGFESAERALRLRVINAYRENRSYSEPEDAQSPYTRFLVSGPASAYLLACFGDGKSLPIMLRGYRSKKLLPMDQTFLFYSMHLIARGHPRDGLGKEAIDALDAYLAAATSIPSPDHVVCPGWDDPFDQTDFRSRMFGMPLPSDPAKYVTMVSYPPLRTEDGLQPWNSAPEMDRLVKQLERFISLAYGR